MHASGLAGTLGTRTDLALSSCLIGFDKGELRVTLVLNIQTALALEHRRVWFDASRRQASIYSYDFSSTAIDSATSCS